MMANNHNRAEPDVSSFENSEDTDQLASMKPADQNPHCFPPCLQTHANKWNPAIG